MHSDQKERHRRIKRNETFEGMSGQIYERRAQLESRAPLNLVTTLEIDDIPMVELTMNFDDGQKKKVKVPTHNLERLEQVFYCFHEFLEAARKLQLDGLEWFDFYWDTLRGHVHTAWDLIVTTTILERDRNEQVSEQHFDLLLL